MPIGRRRFERRVGVAWLLAAFLLAAVVPCARSAAATCTGKRVTIASNGPKIVGTKASDVIFAGPGDNVIYGMGGNDTICGGEGDDTIDGGRGNDSVFGEGGNDTVNGERGSDDLDGGSGEDRVLGSTGNDTLTGGPGDHDQVDGGPGDDSVSGGPGDFDVIAGGPGNDEIDGGPGAHDIASYTGIGGAVTIDLGSGTVSGAEGEHLSGIEDAIGGSADDILIGDAGTPNRLDGGPGDDRLTGVGPEDEALGGPGSDSCNGFAAETSCGPMQGAAGTAVELYGSIDESTSLIVTGNDGSDNATVSVGGGAYVVQGEPGGNAVLPGDPDSSCTRDSATNSVSCHGSVSSILASLGAGNDSFAMSESVPAGVSAIVDGGKGSDTLQGGRGNDTIYAGDDHDPDTIEGGGGDDVLYGVNIFHPRRDSGPTKMSGGPGDDLLIGGQPCDGDLFDGGPGDNDSASFARVRNSGIFVKATIGGAVLDPDVAQCNAGQIEHSVEKIEGSPGPDILIGDETPNTLLGRGGDDLFDGMGGSDDCIGGGANDSAANCEFTASVP